MDGQKDTQKGDILARFIDGQVVRTNPFGDNKVGDRAYRRAERIVAGLHLLTAHISSEEPIRGKIRFESLELLAKTLALRDEMRTIDSTSIGSFQVSVRYLISLVRMLTAGGFVSFQNADTVIAALDELSGFIGASQRTALAESIAFDREDFIGPIGPLSSDNRRVTLKDLKDTINTKDKELVKDNKLSIKRAPAETTSQVKERSQNILDVLRSGGDFSIRDICARVPDYSEKMVQRELLALVAAGTIKKVGLKRWSRYSIA